MEISLKHKLLYVILSLNRVTKNDRIEYSYLMYPTPVFYRTLNPPFSSSSSSSVNTDDPVLWAFPDTSTTTAGNSPTVVCSCTLAVKQLPVSPLWLIRSCPRPIWPLANCSAMRAVVPEPHGLRSAYKPRDKS